MKRLILVGLLVAVAGVAGVVRVYSKRGVSLRQMPRAIVGESETGNEQEEIRKTYELSPGARVEISGINGAVKIETSESKTAEVYVLRTATSKEVLGRRKITIEASSNNLSIRSEKGDIRFFDQFFGSNPREQVTLKLPRQVALVTSGVNGAVNVGDLVGSVEVHGINGRVEIGQLVGSAEFRGINGNVSVALKQIEREGVSIGGINGNIELQLLSGINADLEAHGMNGNVRSDRPDVIVQKSEHGNRFSAHIGSGGASISVSGVNGNVRLTTANLVRANADE
jgi:hypothetical protein